MPVAAGPGGPRPAPRRSSVACVLRLHPAVGAGHGRARALGHRSRRPRSAGGDVAVLDADPLTPGKNGITRRRGSGRDRDRRRSAATRSPRTPARATCPSLDVNTRARRPDAGASQVDRARRSRTRPGTPIRAQAGGDGRPSRPAATIGVACPATPTGLVYVAYPSCHLVAGVDVVDRHDRQRHPRSTPRGTPTIVDGNVTCPDECGGGGASTPAPRPVALDLERRRAHRQRRVLAIGADNSNVRHDRRARRRHVAADVAVDRSRSRNTTGDARRHRRSRCRRRSAWAAARGSINDDTAPGGQFQFVYAVATDNTRARRRHPRPSTRSATPQVDPRLPPRRHERQAAVVLPGRRSGDAAAPRRRDTARASSCPAMASRPRSRSFRVDTFDGDRARHRLRRRR